MLKFFVMFCFVVVPQQSNTSEIVHELGSTNVTIDCPLQFGSLRKNWSVEWIAVDSNDNTLPSSGYFTVTEPKYQLVIKNISVNYKGANFRCQAILGHTIEDSQLVTLNLFRKSFNPMHTLRICMNYTIISYILLTDDAEIVSLGPSNPVIVSNVENGLVTCEDKAYPSPNIDFCYNGTCSGSGTHNDRVQILPSHSDDPTTHIVRFIVHDIKEEDNGNVTCRVSQTERNITVDSTVMLFVPCK